MVIELVLVILLGLFVASVLAVVAIGVWSSLSKRFKSADAEQNDQG